MYSVKKFPDYEKDAWIAENKALIQEQVKKFEGLFEEPLRGAFEEIIAQYVFFSNTMEEVVEWKQDFARFLSYSINASEIQIKQGDSKRDFHGGRLSMIKEILEWF